MRIRRMAVVGLSLATALTFAVAGCDTANDGGTAGAPATTADPVTALSQAAAKLGETSFKVKMDMGAVGSLTGEMDSPNKAGTMTMKMPEEEGMKMSINMLMVKTDLYIKFDIADIDVPELELDKWMHVDMSKLPKDNSLGIDPNDLDPANASTLLNSVVAAERVDDRTFKGTIDLSKAVGALGIEEADLKKLDDKSKKIAFEATVDEQGRLTSLTSDLPAIGEDPAHKMTVTYSDFGSKVNITKPPANEVSEAPSDFMKDFA